MRACTLSVTVSLSLSVTHPSTLSVSHSVSLSQPCKNTEESKKSGIQYAYEEGGENKIEQVRHAQFVAKVNFIRQAKGWSKSLHLILSPNRVNGNESLLNMNASIVTRNPLHMELFTENHLIYQIRKSENIKQPVFFKLSILSMSFRSLLHPLKAETYTNRQIRKPLVCPFFVKNENFVFINFGELEYSREH